MGLSKLDWNFKKGKRIKKTKLEETSPTQKDEKKINNIE